MAGQLGVSAEALRQAMEAAGGPHADLAEVAKALGVSEQDLRSALPPPQRLQRCGRQPGPSGDPASAPDPVKAGVVGRLRDDGGADKPAAQIKLHLRAVAGHLGVDKGIGEVHADPVTPIP